MGGMASTQAGLPGGTTGASASATTGAKKKITGGTDFREAGSGAPTAPTIGREEETSASEPSPGATSPGKSGPSAGEPTRAPSGEVTPSKEDTARVATGNQETENKAGCPAPLPPPPVCHGPLGEEKSPGDIWTANCHKCTCTNANAVDCKPKECPSPPTCKTGERLVKFKDNDTCCEIGYCEPRTCLFNNINYEIGDSFGDPNNPCVTYSCDRTGFIAVVQNCPHQTWCAEADRVYDSKKCCYTCNTNCRSSLVNVTVKYNGCKKKIEMARCVGECKKTIRYNYNIFQLENSCLCCQDESYEFREIVLDCPGGSTIAYRYRHITKCSCLNKCYASTSSSAS
ncbi:apomucin-like isoform X2 [Pteronotus mesoamericanus]|uniref:apomucin-like isoform X2 n=1 Tax=Pteronotus mesoamericanus TaxID=1884717 RepID=UPI0023EBF0A1|nr:apomucin-like isoform X2 [Pteronotus parnellii mesoamericanus]